jgi:hypothetical protein
MADTDNFLLEIDDPGMTSMDMAFGSKGDSADTAKTLAESQIQIAEEQWQTYKDIFMPYEKELVSAHRSIIPEQLKLDLATLGAKTADVEGRVPLNEELRQQQMRSLQRSEPIEQQFYDQARQGLNIQDRMAAAQADVQQGYDVATPQMERQFSRMGLAPASGKFTDAMANMTYSKARDIAFARTNARRQAEDVNFGRLGSAMQTRGNIAGLTAQTGAGATNPLGQGMAGIGLQKAGQSLTGMQGAVDANVQAAEMQAAGTQSAVSGAGAVLSMFSDERLKTNVVRVGTKHNMPWYTWQWNDIAKDKFGLEGTEVGHMATDVELNYPELIAIVDGYKTVNYGGLV